MRLDITEHPELAGYFTVFLNGEPVEMTFMADEENGEIWRHHMDARGEYWPQMPHDVLTGKVEIKPGTLAEHGRTAKPVLHPGKAVE